MKNLLFIFLLIISHQCLAQCGNSKLIVAEYRVDSPKVGTYTFIVSYNFNEGILQSKDTIMGSPTSEDGPPGNSIRFDLGKHFIYKNRYVVSGSGNIIDLKKKALLMKASDNFVEARGDTMIFHRNNVYTGTGFLLLDLSSGKYDFTGKHDFIDGERRDRDREERTSPDKKHYLSIDRTEIPYKIWLHDSTGKKDLLVKDAGHGPNIMYSSQFPTIETFWLDNNLFLYAIHETKFSKDREKKSRGYSKVTLRVFNTSNYSDQELQILDSVGNEGLNGRFFHDKIGQYIYRTSGMDYYRMDTALKKLVDYPFYELGSGFSISNKFGKEGNIIKYNNNEIGTVWCTNPVVSEGMLAVEYGETGSNLAYPKGVKVWSDFTKVWTACDIPWISSIIGWIKED